MNHVTNILVKKPDFTSLQRAGFTLTDMHFHSRYSDTYTPVDKIVERAALLGINLALTDHNTIEGARQAYNNRLKVNVIPGIEVSCVEGEHILLYFSTFDELEDFYINYVKDKRIGDPWTNTFVKTDELLEACQHYSCMAVAAHPFAPGYYGIEKSIVRGFISPTTMDKLHAVEAICGGNLRKNNLKAIELVGQFNFSFTGGSDGHNLTQLGDVVVATKSCNTAGILNEIREKRNLVIGTESAFRLKLLTGIKSMLRHSKYLRYSAPFKYSNLYKKSLKYYGHKIKEKLP